MADEPITQQERLAAAARIKAIGDGPDRFDARDADALHALLRDMPIEGSTLSLGITTSGPGASGVAAGVGKVDLEGERKSRRWSVGEREFRCGAYVVSRQASHTYDIRHVAEVDANERDGHIMRLRYDLDGWSAYLNKPRKLRIWPFELTLGRRFVHWKRSV